MLLGLALAHCRRSSPTWQGGGALKELSLANNRLMTLPDELWRCGSLHTLDLANNQLCDLQAPAGVGGGEEPGLPALEALVLKNNSLLGLREGVARSVPFPSFLSLHVLRSSISPRAFLASSTFVRSFLFILSFPFISGCLR